MITLALGALAAAVLLLGRRPRAATVRARLDGQALRSPQPPSGGLSAGGLSSPRLSAGGLSSGVGLSEATAEGVLRPTALVVAGALAAGVLCILVAGVAGAVAAVIVMPVVAVILRRQIGRTPGPMDTASRAALPLTCDLIAAGVRSGAAVPTALAATARTAPAGLGDELSRVAALLSLGMSAGEAWSALARDPVLGSVAVVAARSADSGIRLADALSRCARDHRAELHAASVARAERVGVMALLPLGLCFLPAFICLGVVPVVAGIAADVFSRVAP